MLDLRCLLLALTLAIVSAQNIGPNYGINIRLSQRGLNYAAQQAVNELYDKYRNERIPDIHENSRRQRVSATNIRLPVVSRPTFRIQVNRGQGITASLSLANIKVTGSFRAKKKIIFWIRKSGSFSVNAGGISVNAGLSVGNSRGRPTVSLRSCSASISTFKFDIRSGGLFGWILSLFERRIGRKMKASLQPKLCDQLRKLIPRVNQKLAVINVTPTLQDSNLKLDYSLLGSPVFGSSYIDTIIKGDVIWKGRRTGTRTATRNWPVVPGSSSRMVTIYITDYVMNALGVLLHNDQKVSYYVSRDKVSSTIRPWLALSCPSSTCAGSPFPELASQYPDGWLEVDLRTTSAPRLVLGTNVVNATFAGRFTIYVKRPSGQKIQVASASATLSVSLGLSIRNDVIRATVRDTSISISGATATTTRLQDVLTRFQSGFMDSSLNILGSRGFSLPSYKGVTFVNPRLYIRNGIIAVMTDLSYSSRVAVPTPRPTLRPWFNPGGFPFRFGGGGPNIRRAVGLP